MAGRSGLSGQALSYFGVIQSATHAHATTHDIWQAIHAEAERRGEALPPGMFAAVNALRSSAGSLRGAESALAKAAASEAVTAQHLAPLPYGHNPAAEGGPRAFDVRVSYTAVRSGLDVQDYVTLRYTGGLPLTVGELRQEALDVTSSLVEGYGASFGEITGIEIGEL